MLNDLEEVIVQSASCLENRQINGWIELSDRFHLIFYRYANNSRLEKVAKNLRAQITLLSNLYQLENKNVDQIQKDHENIYEAMNEGDIGKAEKDNADASGQ